MSEKRALFRLLAFIVAQFLGENMKLFLFALSIFFYLPSLHAFKITSDQDIRHLILFDGDFSKTIQAESLLRG